MGMALICGVFLGEKRPQISAMVPLGGRKMLLCVLCASARDSLAVDEGERLSRRRRGRGEGGVGNGD